MKCTTKASTYTRRLSPKLLDAIPDSICLFAADESIPKDVDAKNCICIADNMSAKDVINLVNATGVNHVVQQTSIRLAQELAVSAKIIKQVGQFNHDPASHVFSAKKIEETSWVFCSLEEKDVLKTKLKAHLKSLPRARHVEKAVLTITDELFTNCLYHNLPAGADQKDIEQVKLPAGSMATLSIVSDEDLLFITCKDPFGSLTRERLLKPVWATYRGEKIKSINLGEGGAGIGCRMMFNHSTSFFAVVMPNESTFIGIMLPLGVGNNVSLERSKNIHLSLA